MKAERKEKKVISAFKTMVKKEIVSEVLLQDYLVLRTNFVKTQTYQMLQFYFILPGLKKHGFILVFVAFFVYSFLTNKPIRTVYQEEYECKFQFYTKSENY